MGLAALGALAVALASGAGLWGQVTGVTATGDQGVDASTNGALGTNPVRLGLHYTVDPATGMLGIQLTFPLPTGSRGPNLPLSLIYSSSFVHPRFSGMIGTPPKYLFGWQQNYAQTESGNWQVGEPTLNVSKVTYSGLGSDGEPDNCVETGPYIFTDSAGRSHDLGVVHVAPQDQYGAGLCPDPEADTAVAADDDGLRSVMV
ncbi:MAG: hypothetical protein ACRD1A_14105, partial [Terriglobales bacterium]